MEFLYALLAFEIVTDIYDLIIGAGLVWGALKWKKGLITATAVKWGLFLGLLLGGVTMAAGGSEITLIFFLLTGVIIFPALTYSVPSVNRFVLGFIVVMKITFMVTTEMFRSGDITIENMFLAPLFVGTIMGLVFAAWKSISALPFVSACAFLGASSTAPVLAKYVNQFLFAKEGDLSNIIDPLDLIFGIFGIELTDGWTLFFLCMLMIIGVPKQIHSVYQQGYDISTPIITIETSNKDQHGKIYRSK